jgi:hypothetical protein
MFHYIILKSAINRGDIMPMCNSANQEALGYWTIGIQYLHMVEMVAKETIIQGNKFMAVSDNEISWEQLPEITRKQKREAQYPVVDSRGMDFPLVLVK